MKPEQLTRAKEIQTEITNLSEHAARIEYTFTRNNTDPDGKTATLSLYRQNYGDIAFKDEFLPLGLPIIKRLYILSVQDKIKELETEFNNL